MVLHFFPFRHTSLIVGTTHSHLKNAFRLLSQHPQHVTLYYFFLLQPSSFATTLSNVSSTGHSSSTFLFNLLLAAAVRGYIEMREKWDKRVFLISYYYKNSCIHTTIYILNAIAYFYLFISHIYTFSEKVQLFGKCIQLVQLFLCTVYTLHFQQLWKLNLIMYYLKVNAYCFYAIQRSAFFE